MTSGTSGISGQVLLSSRDSRQRLSSIEVHWPLLFLCRSSPRGLERISFTTVLENDFIIEMHELLFTKNILFFPKEVLCEGPQNKACSVCACQICSPQPVALTSSSWLQSHAYYDCLNHVTFPRLPQDLGHSCARECP